MSACRPRRPFRPSWLKGLASVEPSAAVEQGWKHVWVAPGGDLCAGFQAVGHPLVEKLWLIAPVGGPSAMMRAAHASATMTMVQGGQPHDITIIPASATARAEDSRIARVGIVLHPWITADAYLSAVTRRLTNLLMGMGSAGTWLGLPAPAEITTCLETLHVPTPASCVVEVTRALSRSPTRAAFASAVERLGQSERTIRRRLRSVTGLSPDALRRIKRADAARRQVGFGTESLSDVAASLDFADQAHMTREFVALCGYTPERWRSRIRGWRPWGHTMCDLLADRRCTACLLRPAGTDLPAA